MKPSLALVLLAAGCVPESYPPPLRPAVVEAPTVLDAGRTGIQGSVAGRIGTGQPPLDAWTVRARHGFGERIEASIGATYFHDSSDRLTPQNASGETLRVGVRYQFWKGRRHRVGTVFAGAGGGAFDHGGLVGGDLGVAVGTDMLFFTGRFWISSAFGAAPIDDGYYQPFCIFCSDPPIRYRNVPLTAGGFDAMLGLHGSLADYPNGKVELVLGGGPAIGFASQPHIGFVGGAGLEYVF